MPILAWLLTKLGSGFVTGLVGQITAIYAKSKDTKLAALQAVTQSETTQNVELLQQVTKTNEIREAGNHGLVAQVIIAVFCIPFAMHMAAITLDSTFMLGCNHYGCWGIPPLPKPYDGYEWAALQTFLLMTPALPLVSAGARLLVSKI